jgi:hypothetical protein
MMRYVALVLCGALIGWSLARSPTRQPGGQFSARPRPTPREARIVNALDQPSELDVHQQPLRDVIRLLAQRHQIEIELDTDALHDAGIDDDKPVTCKRKDITLRSALKLLLGGLDLTYVVGDGYILITSKSDAENEQRVCVYPVDDLVTTASEFRAPVNPSGKNGGDSQNLINVVTSIIAPTTWDEVGGAGSATAHVNSRALVVSQTDEVHEEVVALLRDLRRVRDSQIAAAKSVAVAGREPYDTGGRENLEVRAYRFFPVPTPVATGAMGFAPYASTATGTVGAPAAKTAETEVEVAAKLDAWTKVVTKLVPEVIAPKSWEPLGAGQIRAASGMVVVRQTPDVQVQVGKLMSEMMLAGTEFAWYPLAQFYRAVPTVPLPVPPLDADWPQEAEPPPTSAEARISAALGRSCDVMFAGEPLADVLTTLAERYKIEIEIDDKALEKAGVASDIPITRSLRGVSLKTGLKFILDELDLTVAIHNGALLVTSMLEAENLLVVKVYPVFDLVVKRPGASSRSPAMDFQSLIDTITCSLAPTTWDEVGGPGAIQAFTNSGALVIAQTGDVHEQIAALLRALREAAAERSIEPDHLATLLDGDKPGSKP